MTITAVAEVPEPAFIREYGNMWDCEDLAVVCVTTNGVVKNDGELVMGSGVAKEAKERYPGLAKFWGSCVAHDGNLPYVYVATNKMLLISFPTKNHYGDASDPELIDACAAQIRVYTDVNHWPRVDIPYPGIGYGQLTPETVEPILVKHFNDDRFHIWTFAP